ncbi:MAG: DUF885 domain-containing protein [Bacteroidota bacterium]|nr:DUF885 domain-containing protein [Bacteroidota bacterium]
MMKISWLILLLLSTAISLPAQEKKSTGNIVIEKALKEIKDFKEDERKRDSIAGHPLGSHKEEDFLRHYTFYKSVDAKLKEVNKTSLSFDDEINIELLEYDMEDEISGYTFKSYLNPILSDEGFHTGLPSMASGVLVSKKEFADYIKKLKDIPRYVQENLDLMRKGLALGICQPRAILNGYENTYERQIADSVEKSVFWKPFLKKPFSVEDDDWNKIREEGREAIKNDVIESYKRIKTFFDTEYLPKTRTTIGVSHFPNGLAYYEDRVHHYTTTDISYEEVYQLGLKEVERIKKEMLDVLKEVNFTGTLQEFIAYLRTDPKFYATTPEQLLKEASYIAKQIDGKLPMLFGKLPRQPYGVEPVPEHLAPTYTAGRYSGAPINSKSAGHYWVNTYDLKSRPLYALESLTMHEAVPGHHLQIALTQELTNLPEFRRNLYVNAFGEGWGLYCEYLGTEMGFYKDPYSRFGKLTYEMWRACRLVIDVGLHAKEWTREQAVQYLAENTALSLHEVNTEINRYISWPGQALAYKMGELKIKELREKAETRLKDKFDVREFHDLILSQGTVTLMILEKMVDRYIADKLKVVK